KQILTAPRANLRFSAADVSAASSAIADSAVLLTQLEAPVEVAVAAAQVAQRAGSVVVLDPAPAVPLPDALLRLVYLIRPNSEEAEVLTGVKVRDAATAKTAATALLERGVRVAVVQAGSQGDLMVWQDDQGL